MDPVIVTEHIACVWLTLVRGHVVGLRETEPVPLWDQLTVPAGEEPITLAVQVMVVDEPATADLGVQETVVFVPCNTLKEMGDEAVPPYVPMIIK